MMIRPGSINGIPGHFVHICYGDCPDESPEGLDGFFSFISKALNPISPAIKFITHPSLKTALQTAPLGNTKFGWQLEKTVGPIAAYFIPVVGAVAGPLATAGSAASRARTLARDQANAIRDAQNKINQALQSGAPIDPATGLPVPADAGASNMYPSGGGSGGSISDQVSQAYESLSPDTRKYLKYGAYAVGAFVLYKFLKPKRYTPVRRRRRHVSAA